MNPTSTVQAKAVFDENGKLLGLEGDNAGELWKVGSHLNYERAPTQEDNAKKGYTASSVWQFGGNIYVPAVAPDENSASWIEQQFAGALPGDVLGAAGKCVGGLCAMYAGFTGPAIELTAIVGGLPVVTAISILAGGLLDNDAVRKVFATADVGSFVYVTKVYDQSGNNNHLTLVVAGSVTRGFYLTWSNSLKYWVMSTDENYSALGQALSFPAGLTVTENAMGAFFMGEGTGSYYMNNTGVIASFGTGMAATSIHVGESAAGPSIAGWSGSSRKPTEANIAPMVSGPTIAYMSGSAGQTKFGVNEDSFTFNQADAAPRSGGRLGNWDLGGDNRFSPMRFVGFAIANATPSDAKQKAIRFWFYTRFNVLPQIRDWVVFIGDSRGSLVNSTMCVTTGQHAENISVQLAKRLKSNIKVINASGSGVTINFESNCIANNVIPGLVGSYRKGVNNIAVILLGVNEFIKAALSPGQALANIAAQVKALKAAGWFVMVISELTTNNTVNNCAANTDTLRDLINGGGTGAHEVVDLSDFAPINMPGSAAFYPDGLHPGGAVTSLVGGVLAKRVDAVIQG